MKNAYFYYLLFMLTTLVGYGQNENNHWILGTSDVNFSSNPPVVNTVSNSGNYGKASVSDANGNLLFYTDGMRVWNKNHQVMSGGSYPFFGGGSWIGGSFNNGIKEKNLPVIIVPHPNNDKKYYIITTFNELVSVGNGYNPGLSYHCCVVDFSDVLYPFGKIIDSRNWGSIDFLDNSTIDFSFRPVTCVKNATNDGFFIITHFPSASDGGSLVVYKVSSSGITQTSYYSIGHNIPYTNYPYNSTYTTDGVMRFSKDNLKFGELIADNGNGKSLFYALDFNNATGTFSNYTVIESNLTVGGGFYKDFEFSDDSSKAFLIKNNSEIYVKDLTNLSSPVKKLTVYDLGSNVFGTHLQRDKNDNVLVSYDGSNFLHKINNQDSYANSSVNLNFVSLSGALSSGHTLPQLIPVLQPCYTNLAIPTNVTSGTDKKQASNTITASNIISNGAGAIYHAGNSVTLTNGFHAVSGSTFRAYIEGCSNSYVARTSDNEEIKEELVKDEIKLYPNPNNGIFTIDLANESEIAVSIYDTFGKQVYHSSEKISSFAINLPNLSAGLYIAQLQGKDYNKTIKFIKK